MKARHFSCTAQRPCTGFSASGVVLGTAADRGAVMAPHGLFDPQSDVRPNCILCAKFHHAEIIEFFLNVELSRQNMRHSCRVLRQIKFSYKYFKFSYLKVLLKKHDIYVAKNVIRACSPRHV